MKKGSHHVPETRAKMCAAHQDILLSPEHCAAIAVGGKGNKNAEGHIASAETCAKMRAAHQGKYPSAEARAKMREAQSNRSAETCAKMSAAKLGPNHPNWMGGISRDPYGWEFNDELKEEVRRRDGYKCQLCGVPQAECRTRLPIHHIDYDKKNSDPVNLTALCGSCNSKVNANREHWTAFFRAKMLQQAISSLKQNTTQPFL